jgi:ABC-type uncharacterized transport system permease subunit
MIAGILAIIVFALTTLMLWRYLQKKVNPSSQLSKSTFLSPWALALIVMAVFIYTHLYHSGGIDLGFYNSLLLASFVICMMLFVASFIKPVEHLGMIVLPVTIICLILNLSFHQPANSLTYNAGIQTHIIASIIAFSILCLAAVQAILLFIQERNIKQHTSSGLLRSLPSLHESETILFQSIILGVLVLTLALVTGFIFLDDIFAQHLVHKTTLSCLAWLVFVVLLWGRFQFGWRGATAVRWYLGGFSFLILAYYGSKFVLELILNNQA